MAASESFERALKESISNLLEGFDGVDKLSDEQTSGVLNFIQLTFNYGWWGGGGGVTRKFTCVRT